MNRRRPIVINTQDFGSTLEKLYEQNRLTREELAHSIAKESIPARSSMLTMLRKWGNNQHSPTLRNLKSLLLATDSVLVIMPKEIVFRNKEE